jgi:hypothetical protein
MLGNAGGVVRGIVTAHKSPPAAPRLAAQGRKYFFDSSAPPIGTTFGSVCASPPKARTPTAQELNALQ